MVARAARRAWLPVRPRAWRLCGPPRMAACAARRWRLIHLVDEGNERPTIGYVTAPVPGTAITTGPDSKRQRIPWYAFGTRHGAAIGPARVAVIRLMDDQTPRPADRAATRQIGRPRGPTYGGRASRCVGRFGRP